jgi:hypothetical protein
VGCEEKRKREEEEEEGSDDGRLSRWAVGRYRIVENRRSLSHFIIVLWLVKTEMYG